MKMLVTRWAEDEFCVTSARGAAAARGLRSGVLGVYARQCTGRNLDVAYLIHVPTGLGLGAFSNEDLACSAGDAVKDLVASDRPDWGAIASRFLARLASHGFYRSHVIDDGGNLLWDCVRFESAAVDAA